MLSVTLPWALSVSGWLPALLSGVGGLLGALVGGVVAGSFKVYAEKRHRRSSNQVAALHELQETAGALRQVLIDAGEADMTSEQLRRYDELDGRLGWVADRVACDLVRESCERWVNDARLGWRGAEEVTFAQERERWDVLRAAVRDELRRFDA